MNDSLRTLAVQIELEGVPGLKLSEFFQSLEINMTNATAWIGSVTLYDKETDVLEDAIRQLGTGAHLRIAFGYDTAEPNAMRTFLAAVTLSVPNFAHAGTTVKLELVSRARLYDILYRSNLSFAAGTEISDIIAFIALRYSWNTVDRISGQTTIETTRSPLTEDAATNGESAYKFIKEQLLPVSNNFGGIGDYKAFFDADNVFHFHTPNYLSPKREALIFARDARGEIIEFSVSDNKIFQLALGGGDAVYVGVDSVSGEATETYTSYTDGVDSQGIPLVEGATSRPQIDSPFTSPIQDSLPPRQFVFARTTAGVKAQARTRWERLRNFGYTGTLSRVGSHNSGIHDHLDISIYTRRGSLHYLSGLMQIYTLVHTIEGSTWTTNYTLTRGGTSAGAGATPATGSSLFGPPLLSGQGGFSIPVETG